jgi:release factor glutamine methyltransferase
VNGRPPSSPAAVGAALQRAKRELHSIESGALVAEVLLARALGRNRPWILAHPEEPLSPAQSAEYENLIRRAAGGEPLAYLTGVQDFVGVEFGAAPGALIPRPETELLVEVALDWLAARGRAARGIGEIRAVDLGTGSGCIAVTLAAGTPGLNILATDISPAALAVAAGNIARHDLRGRVSLVRADLLAPLRGPIDLLCANLPYALSPSLEGNPVVRFEPRQAIDGGEDGLRLVSRAIEQAAPRMAAGGLALFEIDAAHADRARILAKRSFPHSTVKVKKDLTGWERLLVIRQP